MKKNILLMALIVVLAGCETGTRYDKNTTTQKVPKHEPKSGLVERDDIESLLDDEEILDEPYSDEREHGIKEEIDSFSSGIITDGLDVREIREGKHKDYIRLVFDVYNDAKAAKDVGRYDAKYHKSKKDISVILHGYRKFSASLPSFPSSSVIEQIHFDQYPDDSGFKFHIKLRKNATVKIFDLKNPARIVFDIKSI
jgi:hypothetical protein